MKNLSIQNTKRELYKVAMQNSQSLYYAVKVMDSKVCARLYEPLAIVQCPEKEVIVGRNDIIQFWKTFRPHYTSKFIEYRSKFSSMQPDSVTISAKWLLDDKQYVLSSETWAIQPNHPCLIIEQRVAIVGEYTKSPYKENVRA